MSTPATATTTGVEGTRSLGASLGELVRAGDLLVLIGDLGSGKTAFAQGLGRGLGVSENITSPTFALVQSYSGRLDLHHLDVYRLESVNEALDLGLAELLDDEAAVLIEWGDTIAPVLPQDYLEVRMGPGDGPDTRVITLSPVGTRWSARMRAVSTVLANIAPGTVGAEPDGAEPDGAEPDGDGTAGDTTEGGAWC